MDTEAANRDPRDQITYAKKEWACPCMGCKKARKQVLKEIQIFLNDKDMMWGWHKANEFIREELGKK